MIQSHVDDLAREWWTLGNRWDDLTRSWRDAVRRDFERRYMAILRAQTERTLWAMRLLADEVEAAKRVLHAGPSDGLLNTYPPTR